MVKEKDEKKTDREMVAAEETHPFGVTPPEEVVAAGTGAETASALSGRDRMKAFWDTRFPDKSYADDEELDGLLADHLERSYDRLSKLEMAEETFRKVAADHPELLDAVEDMARDPEMSVWEALMRNTDGEFDPEEGTPQFERMREARRESMKRREEDENYRRMLADNYEKSRKTVGDYFSKRGMSEADQKALADYIDSLMDSYSQSVITEELLDAMDHARTYRKDVEAAREVGAIEAKNARIDARRQRRAEETDGLPAAGSSAGVPSETPVHKDFLDHILEKSAKRRNW